MWTVMSLTEGGRKQVYICLLCVGVMALDAAAMKILDLDPGVTVCEFW